VSEFHGPQYGPPPGYLPQAHPSPYPPPYPPPPGVGYGASTPWPPRATWHYGPERPTLGTAAGLLGYVTAGLTFVFSVIFLIVAISGDGDPTVGALLLGAPCAVGLIVGAGRLLRRASARTLFASAVASVAVLLLALVVGVAVLSGGDLVGEAVFVVLALPLPVLTAVFARNRTVADWVAAGNR
jgi:hypothetical protein